MDSATGLLAPDGRLPLRGVPSTQPAKLYADAAPPATAPSSETASSFAVAASRAADSGDASIPTAQRMHLEITAAARLETRCRRALGRLVVALRQRKAWQAFGYPRLSDWSRERLGMSASELRTLGRAYERLAPFPAIDAAYAAGEIEWTHVRALADIERLTHPDLWLEEARASTGRALEAKIRALKKGVRVEAIPFVTAELAAQLKSDRDFFKSMACDAEASRRLRNDEASDFATARQDAWADLERAQEAAVDDAALYEQWRSESTGQRRIEGEPAVRLTVPCSETTQLLWLEACEFAQRMLGREAPVWDLVEAMVMEANSSAVIDRQTLAKLEYARVCVDGRDAKDEVLEQLRAWGAEKARAAGRAEKPRRPVDPKADPYLAGLPRSLNQLLDNAALLTCHPSRLDRRMRKIVDVMQSSDARLAALLHRYAPTGFYRYLGHATLEAYAHACLGICPRKLRDLLQVGRDGAGSESGAFEAYRKGRLTRAKLTLLRPVLRGTYAREWTERAKMVTHRRLRQEMTWAKARAHMDGQCRLGPPPPPRMNLEGIWRELHAHTQKELAKRERRREPAAEADAGTSMFEPACNENGKRLDSAAIARRQMRGARGGVVASPMHCTVSFIAPASLVDWFCDVVACFAHLGDRRGDALGRMLEDILKEWVGQPAHRDPVFERDGWRCSVPGCTARAVLHNHHVRFRSRGGGDESCNRMAVCVWHHRRGIHSYVIRAVGKAPDDVLWEVGFKRDGSPILRFRGDYYDPAPAGAQDARRAA